MGIVHGIIKILIVIAGLLSATEALATPPEWVLGNATKYPNAMYLVGRGAGSTEHEAQNRARGDLATIFAVRVKMVSENITTVAKSGNQEQVHELATQHVSAKADKVISGIRIAEIWRDPETNEFHALAVLSRMQAAASLREEMSDLDDGIQMEVDAAKVASDPLRKIAALTRAMQAVIKRDDFQALLKVINSSGRGIAASISQWVVQAQLDDALQSIKIAPEVAPPEAGNADATGDANAKEFATILKNGLAAAGFLAQDPDNADFVLVGTLTLMDADRQNNWYWMRGTVAVSLVEKNSGRVRGGKTWPIKASAVDVKTVRSRALMEIEKLFKQSLRPAIIEFASGS